MNNELLRMWKGVVVAQFEILALARRKWGKPCKTSVNTAIVWDQTWIRVFLNTT